jgi:hypothetical protein
VAYLVADLRLGLQGFRGACLSLLCDPRSPTVSMLDLGHSSAADVRRGVSSACSFVDTALRGVLADGPAVVLGDSASPSSLLNLNGLDTEADCVHVH